MINAVSARIAKESDSGDWSAKRVEKEFKQAKRPSPRQPPVPSAAAAAGSDAVVAAANGTEDGGELAQVTAMLRSSQQRLAELQARVAQLESSAGGATS